MSKARGARGERTAVTHLAPRRKRKVISRSTENFVQAFVDALRDILSDELRPTA
jgi:hypothetical protein